MPTVPRVAARAALALTLTLVPAAPAPAASLPPSEWVLGPRRATVMLTFEGHAGARKVGKVLDALSAGGARATFFMSGAWLEHHPGVARAIVEAGHFLGNRGYGRSALFTELDDAAIGASIRRAEQVLARFGASSQPFVRPPKGARDLRVLRVAGSLGYRSLRWTRGFGGGRATGIAARVVRTARFGSIVGLDLWRKSHRKAVPDIVAGLAGRGFRLRTIADVVHAHPIRWDVTLRSGMSGPEVSFLQKALLDRSYAAGARDGSFGYATLQGVYAFEKTHGLARDGVVPPADLTELVVTRRPAPPRRRPDTYIDVDISRQVLFEVRAGRVHRTIPISSGNEEYYEQDGQTYKAHTPRGDFVIERKIPGWRTSRLGRLYYPNYFVGGFAIHGSESVPTYPASHGCVRIPMYIAEPFYDRNPVGTPVFVHD